MSTEQQQSTNDAIKQLFNNPRVQAKFVEEVVGDKPNGWSRKSNATYYKPEYGEQLRVVYDMMVKKREDGDLSPQIWHYADYKCGRNTLYLRINQSIRYLCDRLDTPEHKYAKIRDRIRVEKLHNIGIKMSWVDVDEQSVMIPRKLDPQHTKPVWMKKVERFVTESEPGGEPFFEKDLALSPEDIMTLKTALAQVPQFIHSITSFSIKIIHTKGVAS